MNKTQLSALRRFRRVQNFLATNPNIGPAEALGEQLNVLDDVIAKLTSNGEVQDASTRFTRGETARQRVLREDLWNRHMVPLSRVARRAIGVPGMDAALFLPKKRADNEALLNAARGMAQAAEAQPELFVRYGMGADFVAQFRSAIGALSQALITRVESQKNRQYAGKIVSEQVKRGIAAVDLLDAIVAPRLEGNPALLGAWRAVKRPIEPGVVSSVGGSEPLPAPEVKVA